MSRPRRPADAVSIVEAMRDPELFGPWFTPAESWARWAAFLQALFGLSMGPEARAIYHEHTRRERAPSDPREAWVIAGRRGGKSLIAALVAVYLACFRDYSKHLAPGERATVLVLASDRRQARVVMRYVEGFLDGVPMLARLVERRTQEEIHLATRVSIEVHAASFRGTRGYSLAGVILDELAFWASDEDGSNPDREIVRAVRPGMATIPGSLLVAISSPYARRGELWNAHRRWYGTEDPRALVWQAPSRAMNPTLPESVVQQALEEDELAARAEYLAEFRSDIEALLTREAVETCVEPDRFEVGRISGVAYHAFVDPSGGSADSMTLAVGHGEGEAAILDCLRERRPPFSPEAVVSEFADTLRSYGVERVTGDRYGAAWVAERFEKAGIRYQPAEKPKSDLYRELLPAMNSGRVVLLANEKLISQLVGLERRTARGGRDTIDHAPGGHDDLANAAAGVVALVLGREQATWESLYGEHGVIRVDEEEGWQRLT